MRRLLKHSTFGATGGAFGTLEALERQEEEEKEAA